MPHSGQHRIRAPQHLRQARELLFTFVGPGRVWIVARINIDDGQTSGQVRALVRGIESGMKQEAKDIYRVDVVPIGEAQPASS
jgi:hypothetical protein